MTTRVTAVTVTFVYCGQPEAKPSVDNASIADVIQFS